MSKARLIGRFLVADPGLHDDSGHHYATSLTLAREATQRGMAAQVLGAMAYAGAGRVQPVFSRSLYQPREQARYPLEAARRSGPAMDRNSVDLLTFGAQANVTAADIFMFHTVTIDFLESLLEYFLLTPQHQLGTYHFLFRYDPATDTWAGNQAQFAETVRRLKALDLLGRRIFLYAETDALAQIYSDIAGVPVTVLYHFSVAQTVALPPPATGPVRVGYFGEARLEKGIDAYHRAVEKVMDRLGDRARFVTQCYTGNMNSSPAIAEASAFFWGERYRARHAVHAILDDADYERELASSDILIVAHRTPRYANRGSGVFVDGIVHDKLMIVRSGTWMSTICPEDLTVTFNEDHELPEAIERAVKIAEARRHSPGVPNPAKALFDVRANIQEVLRNHMSAVTTRRTGRHPRVLHIAPFWVRQGSTRVYESQLRALAEIGATVMCVHLANFPIEADRPAGTYRWFFNQAPAEGAVYQWLVAVNPGADTHGKSVAGRLMGKDLSWVHEWTQAHTFEIPASLSALVQAGGVDLVVLNYAHNMPLVQRLGLAGTPVIVETHDIRAHQFASLGEAEDAVRDETAEMAALAAPDALVFINRDEAGRVLAEVGPKPAITVLPTLPLDLDRGWLPFLRHGHSAQRAAVFEYLADRLGAPSVDRAGLADFYVALRQHQETPERLVCFLGSSHRWNMISLDWFYDEVFVPHLLRRGVCLVIAGRAASEFTKQRGRQHGVLALGELADVRFLYESDIAFVLPVQGGTGFPIKTLEALLAGNPVVGSSQAFRGFPDLAGIAAIADEPPALAQAVLDLATTKRGARLDPPAMLSWPHYRSAWAGLVEQVTGKRLKRAAVQDRPVRASAEALAAIPPLRPLFIADRWTCSAETQPDFLAASVGFKPSPSEKTFCWSANNVVAVELECEGPVTGVEFDVAHVTPPAEGGPTQDAVLFCDGALAGRVTLSENSRLMVPLAPGGAGVGRRRISIELVFPRARYGLEFGGWKDDRRLGFAVAGISLCR